MYLYPNTLLLKFDQYVGLAVPVGVGIPIMGEKRGLDLVSPIMEIP